MSLLIKLNNDVIIKIITYLLDVDICKFDTSLTNKLYKNQLTNIYSLVWLNNYKVYDRFNNEFLIHDAYIKINTMNLNIKNLVENLNIYNVKIYNWLISKNINFNNLQIIYYVSDELLNYVTTKPNMIKIITYFSLDICEENLINLQNLINYCIKVEYLNISNVKCKLFEKLNNNLNLISINLNYCHKEIQLNFNKFCNLTTVIIIDCSALKFIDLEFCIKLSYFKIKDCSNITSLNFNHYELNSLLILDCENLNLINIMLCPNLTNLSLSCSHKITILSDNSNLIKLQHLMLYKIIDDDIINNFLYYASNLLILQLMHNYMPYYNINYINNLKNLQLLILNNYYLTNGLMPKIIKNCLKLNKILIIDTSIFDIDMCIALIDANNKICINSDFLNSNNFELDLLKLQHFELDAYNNSCGTNFLNYDYTMFIYNNNK